MRQGRGKGEGDRKERMGGTRYVQQARREGGGCGGYKGIEQKDRVRKDGLEGQRDIVIEERK